MRYFRLWEDYPVQPIKKRNSSRREILGKIYYRGKPLCQISEREAVEEIGEVFQDLENQIVLYGFVHELAFGMGNLGEILTMKKRIGEMCNFFGWKKFS